MSRSPARAGHADGVTDRRLAASYSDTGGEWQSGPGQIYDRLADVVVGYLPGPVAGGGVLDLGAGTGSATRAAQRAGAAWVVAADAAFGMLAFNAGERPPAVCADALRLPFPDARFTAVVAAFSLNHVSESGVALCEAARVVAPGGGLVVSAYAEDDTHPAKDAMDQAAAARGWRPPAWYEPLRLHAAPRLATVERAEAEAYEAGLRGARAEAVRVPFPELSPVDLVRWRAGMAQTAPFLGALEPAERQAVIDDAVQRLGDDPPVLVRSLIVLIWRAS